MAIRVDTQGRVRVITIDRAEASNALDPDSMDSLAQALASFRDDEDADVAVLTGTGNRVFCAGADLKQTVPPSAPFVGAYLGSRENAVSRGAYIRALTLHELRIGKPMIAAINGHAIGGGLELALECHVRISTPQASFGLPEARWASVPGAGGVSNLLRSLPRAVAMRMLLTGERIGADEALRYGFVTELIASQDLLGRAVDLANQIAANGPLALRAIVAMADKTFDLGLSQSIETEHLLWGLLRDTEDRLEGRTAFAEQRSPRYQGR